MTMTCAACGVSLMQGQATLIRPKRKNDPPIPLCANCLADVEREVGRESEGINLPAAALVGLLAAGLSAAIWYAVVVLTEYQLGILAVGVGWLVGKGVMLGAGRKRGLPLQILSVAITIAAMAMSEYFIVRYFVLAAAEAEGYIVSGVPLLLPLEDILFLIGESIKSDPLTLLFWAIAIWQAFVLPRRRRIERLT